jgi:hypothetical protein
MPQRKEDTWHSLRRTALEEIKFAVEAEGGYFKEQWYSLTHGNASSVVTHFLAWRPKKPNLEYSSVYDLECKSIMWLEDRWPDLKTHAIQDLCFRMELINDEHGDRRSNDDLFLKKPEFSYHLDLFKSMVLSYQGKIANFYSRLVKDFMLEIYTVRSADGDIMQPGDPRISGWIERPGKDDLPAYFFDHPEFVFRYAKQDRIDKMNQLLAEVGEFARVLTVPYQRS